MVVSGRYYMTDAVAAYEEKARDLWLFDYPAQVSLCGTQVWWTTEVWQLLSSFLYNCQLRGYISEGERAIGIQSEQAATLHDSATILQRLER